MMTKPDEIFLKFGQASYFTQCVEMDLVTFYLIDAIRSGRAIVREDLEKLEGNWDDKTFGGLIRPIKNSPYILDKIKQSFEDVREARNYLTHRFFKQYAEVFLTESGQDAMLTELGQMITKIQECNNYLKKVLLEYSTEIGVTDELIKQEMAKLGIPHSAYDRH